MKYLFTISIIVIFMLSGMFFELPLWSYIGISILLFIYLLVWEFSVIKLVAKGDFQMKSHKKSIDIIKYIGLIPFAISVMSEESYRNEMDNFQYGLVFICIVFISFDIITYITYKLKHPVTVCIDNDILLFNNRWPQKRDLKNLNYIGIPSMTGELVLGFITKSDV